MNPSSSNPNALASVATTGEQWREQLREGTSVLIRPIRPADEGLERDFIERLSPQSRHYRFLGTINTPSAEMLRQFTRPELVRGVAYIASHGAARDLRFDGDVRPHRCN